jgi:transcriptional regulator with XRE-family HTH domain
MEIDIPQKISTFRQAQQITQAELARRSGTSRQYIWRMENGKAKLRARMIRQVIKVGLNRHLDISIR